MATSMCGCINPNAFESCGGLFINPLARPVTFCLDYRTPPQLPVTGVQALAACSFAGG
jgi:hypothetical protein